MIEHHLQHCKVTGRSCVLRSLITACLQHWCTFIIRWCLLCVIVRLWAFPQLHNLIRMTAYDVMQRTPLSLTENEQTRLQHGEASFPRCQTLLWSQRPSRLGISDRSQIHFSDSTLYFYKISTSQSNPIAGLGAQISPTVDVATTAIWSGYSLLLSLFKYSIHSYHFILLHGYHANVVY